MERKKFRYVVAVSSFISLAIASHADTQNLKSWGFVSYEAGQIVNGYYLASPVDHVWQHRLQAQIGAEASIIERLRVLIGAEFMLSYSYPLIQNYYSTQETHFFPYIHQAEGVYAAGDPGKVSLEAALGFFPFKYNAQARNLGEYLFRTGTYPGYIVNDFDFPKSRLLGFRLENTLLNTIHNCILLTSETDRFPTQDFSLADILDVTIWKAITVGGAVSFCHLISVNNTFTTPRTDETRIPGDSTKYYTFRGTKLMARFSFDPKALFSTKFLGSEDLLLYGEGAILGVKNYPEYYEKMTERMPVMVGFNIPTFKLLDVLSVEAEWWGNRYPNSYRRLYEYYVPLPSFETVDSSIYRNDDWKWSVYLKKSITRGISIIAQAANDHMRVATYEYTFQDKEETLRHKNDWHYLIKCQFSF